MSSVQHLVIGVRKINLLFIGFMKHLPNLLKQETSSAATLVDVLVRMYNDPRPEHQSQRAQVLDRFIP